MIKITRKQVGLVVLPVLMVWIAVTIRAQGSDENSDLARMAALETRLGKLEQQIRLLEDSKAIKRLQRAYGYYLDKGLSSEVADLFADDATVELANRGVYQGKAHIAALYRRLIGDGPVSGRLNTHIIMQGVVHVAPDGKSAKGRWRALIQKGQYGTSAQWSEGPYENEYVKDGGVWKISKLHWYTTFTAPYDPGWHKAPQPMPGPLADLPADRPPTENYQSYPSAYIPPYHYANPVSGRRYEGQP